MAFFPNFRSFVPVKEGEELNVTIEAIGEKGDGIARVKGFVIFVPGTKKGDTVKIKVTRVLRRVGFGEVIKEKAAEAEVSEITEEAPTEEKPKRGRRKKEKKSEVKEAIEEESSEATEESEEF